MVLGSAAFAFRQSGADKASRKTIIMEVDNKKSLERLDTPAFRGFLLVNPLSLCIFIAKESRLIYVRRYIKKL